MIRKAAVFLMCIMMMLPYVPILAAEGCAPEIDDYTVKDSVNMDMSRVQTGDSVNIAIKIKDKQIKTSEVTADGIDVLSVDGSFGSIEPDSVVIDSDGDSALEYTLNFKDAVYSGTGNAITFKIRYTALKLTSELITAKISECSETEESTPEQTEDYIPYVEITRGDISKPIKPNSDFDLMLIVKNRGKVKITKPYMTVSLPSSIASREAVGNIKLPDIKPGGSAKFTLKLKSENFVESFSEDIDVILNYNYGTNQTGSYSEKILVPMESSRSTSAPIIQILRGKLSGPLNADEEFVLPITIKNVGETEITSPLISFTASEELLFMEDNTSKTLNKLAPNDEIKLELKLKTKKQLTLPTQEINAELKYNYKNGSETAQATDNAKLIVPTKPNTEEGTEPILRIVPNDVPAPVKSGTSFSTAVYIENIGKNKIENAVLTLESGDGLIITDRTSSTNIGTVKAGESKKIVIKARTTDKLSGTAQTVTGELKYNYDNGKTVEKGSESVKLVIPTVPDKEDEEETKLKKTTPNIITDSYSYGGVPVANGAHFELNVVFGNTSRDIPLENIVLTVETGDGVTITSASNTYYYEQMAALGKNSCKIPMQVLPNAESNSVQIRLQFKYEYIDNKERCQVTSEQNISVPVYKPDKLEITLEPIAPATVGQEQTVTLNYVNKGKGQLSNVKAELEGDVTALTSVQNLGNFESGKSGAINFVVVPDMPGEFEFTVKVSYEDANMEPKTLEFPCVIQAEEMSDEGFGFEDYGEEMTDEEGGSGIGKKILIGVGIGVAALIVLIIIIKLIKKRRKAKDTVKIDWEA